MNIFDLVIQVFPVSLVPELTLSFLGGDISLDHLDSSTMDRIFTQKYTEVISLTDEFFSYLDEECTILHSFNDEPAASYFELHETTRTIIWYCNGKFHRDGDKPAFIKFFNAKSQPKKQWFYHGLFHRDGDKPAFICRSGLQIWLQFDNIHRDGGKPALIDKNGPLKWYTDGKLHRSNGRPAIIHPDGKQEWWVEGRFITGFLLNKDGTPTWYHVSKELYQNVHS